MAAIINLTDDAKKYTGISINIVLAFNKKFRNADGMLTANTQAVYSMVLYFGLSTDDNDRIFLAQTLAKNVHDHGQKLTTGMIGTVCLISALARNQQSILLMLCWSRKNTLLGSTLSTWERQLYGRGGIVTH
jgi:hypothetical protein